METPTEGTQFKKGWIGGPGRPKGAKNKITKLFVEDLTEEWGRRGKQALQDLSSKDLVKACIAILPKDVLLAIQGPDKTNWVINAAPRLTESQWRAANGLEHGAPVKNKAPHSYANAITIDQEKDTSESNQ